jgi:hypothetical protein
VLQGEGDGGAAPRAEQGATPPSSAAEFDPSGLFAVVKRDDNWKGGGKLARTETVTVRLDPKLRYLAELAGRLHRRTLSSYIEWAIAASLSSNALTADLHGPSIKDESESLWDVDEADRFAKLALRYPSLLTHDEQVLWKFIKESFRLWGDGTPFHTAGEGELNFGRLRRNWDFIRQSIYEGRAANNVAMHMKE